MQGNHFNFCPKCGSKNIQTENDGRKWVCPDCGFELYNNVAASVAVLMLNDKGEALFEVRAKEPRKGFLALPGGFCEPDERSEVSAKRECLEEIGAEPESLYFIGSFPNTYLYKDIEYKTCDNFFAAKLKPDFAPKLQKSEVSALEWHKVDSKEAIDVLPIAFDSCRQALLEWLGHKAD